MADEPSSKKPNKRTLWLLGGIIAEIAVYVWYRNNKATEAALAATGGGTGFATPTNMPSGAASTTTNLSGIAGAIASFQDWERNVQSWAVQNGYDPAEVQNALTTYASGSCLTTGQYAIIDKGLGQFGFPPDAPYQGLVQCPHAPAPAPKPAPAPAPAPTPAPIHPAAALSDAQFYQLLTQQIGNLSAETGIGAPPEQVKGWFNQYS